VDSSHPARDDLAPSDPPFPQQHVHRSLVLRLRSLRCACLRHLGALFAVVLLLGQLEARLAVFVLASVPDGSAQNVNERLFGAQIENV